jgi:putative glutathione S-transferase
MGLLVDGIWKDEWYDTKSSKGEFIRTDAQFRDAVSCDANSTFPAEADRYHLFVSLACPWAHRTLILRELKGLQDFISVSVVKPEMLENGWELDPEDGSHGLGKLSYLHQVYTHVKSEYSGRVTVPVLFDKKTGQIVSNESSEIIRMFNTAFNNLTGNTSDYYPEELRSDIDAINEDVYDNINNGVYKTGFATKKSSSWATSCSTDTGRATRIVYLPKRLYRW